MKGGSHLLIGWAGVLAIHTAIRPLATDPLSWLLVAGCATAGALLPDIDSGQSTAHRQLVTDDPTRPTGRLAAALVGLVTGTHRSVTHTLIVWGVLTTLALWPGYPGPAIAFSVGYLLHLAADSLTINGIPALWPLYRKPIHLLPRPIRVRTGSLYEYAITVAVGVGVVQLWLTR